MWVIYFGVVIAGTFLGLYLLLWAFNTPSKLERELRYIRKLTNRK
jgi:hypothetical protein